MNGKQAKRYRALEGRVELLESHLAESWMRCGTAESDAEAARQSAQHARRRERETRRREYIWRAVALAAVAAALIVAVLAAWSVRGTEPENPEPAAVVCRWTVECDLE